MPLPPLPDNNTARVWIKYTSVFVEHEIMFRLPSFSTPTDAVAFAAAASNVLKERMRDLDSFLSARYSAAGTIFSVPIAFTTVAGVVSSGVWAQDPESVELSFTGRSFADGRHGAWYFFTAVPTPSWPAKNRYLPGEAAVIDSFRANVTDLIEHGDTPATQVVTIGGSIPTVNQYVNIRFNAEWQTSQR